MIQELAVAHGARVICGLHEVSWTEFSKALVIGWQLYPTLNGPFLFLAYKIEWARWGFDRGVELDLLSVLVSYRSFLAGDPRYKVFALC